MKKALSFLIIATILPFFVFSSLGTSVSVSPVAQSIFLGALAPFTSVCALADRSIDAVMEKAFPLGDTRDRKEETTNKGEQTLSYTLATPQYRPAVSAAFFVPYAGVSRIAMDLEPKFQPPILRLKLLIFLSLLMLFYLLPRGAIDSSVILFLRQMSVFARLLCMQTSRVFYLYD